MKNCGKNVFEEDIIVLFGYLIGILVICVDVLKKIS